MRRQTASGIDRFEELFDRDVDTLIAGGTPANSDLIPLRDFIADLRALAEQPIDEDFIEFHAAESAAVAARAHRAEPVPSLTNRGRWLWLDLRRRVTAGAITVTMLLGASGMAWAADGAVPGDWYYGLDRALETIGIGAGGAAERAEEIRSSTPETQTGSIDPGDPAQTGTRSETLEPSTGLDRAASVVSQPAGENGRSKETRVRVSGLLQYLNDTERIDGGVVSGLSREGAGGATVTGPPEEKGASGSTPAEGKRGSVGRSDSTGGGNPPASKGSSGRP